MNDKGFDIQGEEIIFVCFFVSLFLSHSGLFIPTHCRSRM